MTTNTTQFHIQVGHTLVQACIHGKAECRNAENGGEWWLVSIDIIRNGDMGEALKGELVSNPLEADVERCVYEGVNVSCAVERERAPCIVGRPGPRLGD